MEFNKNFLRKKFKNLKIEMTEKMSEKEKYFLDKNIGKNILKLNKSLEANIILAYMANAIEINIDNIILNFINNNKKVAIPICLDLDSEPKMDFYFINNLSDVHVGKFNIREPNVLENNLFDRHNNLNERVVMLVPGLVFDKRGYRVGYGKGYYDRYLSQIKDKVLKIGLCYDFCLVNKINIDKNDIPVDILVTQTKIIKLN